MLDSITGVLEDQIKDLYSAEKQLLKALPRMAKNASTPELAEAFNTHLEQTRAHVDRLEEVSTLLDIKPGGKKCLGMEGLIKEGEEGAKEDGSETGIDAALIAAAQKVEHYEISAYGTARVLAEQLGQPRIVELLEATLNEEKETDENLTRICVSSVLPLLASQQEEERDTDAEDDDDE